MRRFDDDLQNENFGIIFESCKTFDKITNKNE